MPDHRSKLPRLDWAGFADTPNAGGRSRRKRWQLWPQQEDGAAKAVDVARRFADERTLCVGLGRKKPE
jgi:hypothetical protein